MTTAEYLVFAAIGTLLGSAVGAALGLWMAPKVERFLERRGWL